MKPKFAERRRMHTEITQVPKHYAFVKGAGEGTSKLNAFDSALLDAGIANFNLIKISSIVPPLCKHENAFDLPRGMILPIAYSSYISNKKNEIISATVGVGIPKDFENLNGLIMELAVPSLKSDAEKVVTSMIQEGMANRNIELNDILLHSIEYKVKKLGCVIAGIVLW